MGILLKVAGTERGVTEPQATFSACFGAPFMPLHPTVYAELLADKIRRHNADVWLINTGWTGGPHGVGHRMELSYTRQMLSEALQGNLEDVDYELDDIFGVAIPEKVNGVPDQVLVPRNTWDDKNAYDEKAEELASMFAENFKQFESEASSELIKAGPKV
ncbi:MAG: phosphoenolpyruvate carboxykinase (ATP) [Balneolaceae bacterium]|nr:phosphoenolpyruvate carboxykinase (ATP) [Balneolaceae bacterium]